MRLPWDLARRGPVIAVQTGGGIDGRVLQHAERLALERGDGRLIRLAMHGDGRFGLPRTDRLRVQDVRRPGPLAAAAAGQAREDGASWIVAPATQASRLLRSAPCPLLFLPTAEEPEEGPTIVPVDFFRESLAAAAFARELGGPVELLHAYRVPLGWHKLGCSYLEFAARMEARCRRDMDEALRELRPYAPAASVVLGGDPARTILGELRRKRASGVVLAARRRTSFAALLPSVAERIVSSSPVPAWVLRDDRALTFLDAIG